MKKKIIPASFRKEKTAEVERLMENIDRDMRETNEARQIKKRMEFARNSNRKTALTEARSKTEIWRT